MTDLSPAKPVTAPIPDINGNGILDGDDIRAILEKEEEEDEQRTPNERAHGVLEALGLRQVTDEIRRVVFKNGGYQGNEFAQATQHVVKELLGTIEEIKEKLATIPNYRQLLTEAATKAAKDYGYSKKETEILIADQQNLVDFAETFTQTFPKKQIAIKVQDMPGILGHFGSLPFLVPKAKPPAEKTEERSI